MSATYSLTSSSTDVEASRDLTCASTSGTGISPVVAGDAYDHKGRARPAVGDNEVGKGLSVRVPKKQFLSAVGEQSSVEARDSHKILCTWLRFLYRRPSEKYLSRSQQTARPYENPKTVYP